VVYRKTAENDHRNWIRHVAAEAARRGADGDRARCEGVIRQDATIAG
jgi:hypothetical protein